MFVHLGSSKHAGEFFECGGKQFSVSERQENGVANKLAHSVSDLRTRSMSDFLRRRSPGKERIACDALSKLQNESQGVLLFTPIRRKGDNRETTPLIMGFELLTPFCGAAALSMVRARIPSLASQVVVDAPPPAKGRQKKRRA